eukprot:Nitzschia sp. Nitz4//scaffold215_size37433//12543//12809//NITZ4_007748-RA/size37433-exonerate_est2genome-gene-0.66-mRNA-1//-1//CDS//3329542142//7444//frame0
MILIYCHFSMTGEIGRGSDEEDKGVLLKELLLDRRWRGRGWCCCRFFRPGRNWRECCRWSERDRARSTTSSSLGWRGSGTWSHGGNRC